MTGAKRETSAGGIVLRCTGDGPMYLVILDGYKNWGFPKGHINDGESPADAARREVAEETGLFELKLHRPLSVIDWFFRFRGELIHKYCHFYLFESAVGEPTPQLEEGITAVRWCDLDEALATIRYENARGVLLEVAQSAAALCED